METFREGTVEYDIGKLAYDRTLENVRRALEQLNRIARRLKKPTFSLVSNEEPRLV